eukprot:XP_001695425.1 predicted protein [Chlamydomonas reinhardtii]
MAVAACGLPYWATGTAYITVMYAFARTSFHPSPVLTSRMAAATEADMASFTPRQLEHAAWVLARVRHRPSPTWLDNFASALEVNWDYFRPAQLASTLADAAACGLAALPAATLTDQLPASLRKAAAPDAATAPSTMARLVWSAGHFGSLPSTAPADALQRPGPQTAPSSSAYGVDTHSVSALGGAGGATVRMRAQVREEELLSWWEGEEVLEAAAPEDVVLVLHGLAALGVRPAPAWTSQLLGRLLGRVEAVRALDARHLGLLGWAALKLAEGPLPWGWLQSYMEALQARLRSAATGPAARQAEAGAAGAEGALGGQGAEGGRESIAAAAAEAGPGSGLAEVEQGGAEPADVALALSSLAGLGAHMAGSGEGAMDVAEYWRGDGRWEALSIEERTLLQILGYGPT